MHSSPRSKMAAKRTAGSRPHSSVVEYNVQANRSEFCRAQQILLHSFDYLFFAQFWSIHIFVK